MVRWALTVDRHEGMGSGLIWTTSVIEEVTGTREQAFATLWQHALNHRPVHPRGGTVRRWVLRDGEGFLVVNKGASGDYSCKFQAYEILADFEPGH
ncbi:hypothetical protein OG216_29900 [Streptomycetaceae bacterium NBC_01309]